MKMQYVSPSTQEALVKAPMPALMAAVAIAAAYSVAIPAQAVTNINEYAAFSTEGAICAVVSVFNEVRPMPVAQVTADAIQVYKARYEVAHGVMLENATSTVFDGPLDLFGIGMCLTPDFKKTLKEHTQAIMNVLIPCLKAARQIEVNDQGAA